MGIFTVFINSLLQEIQNVAEDPRFRGFVISSIYLGGGTPSLLGPEQLEKILSLLADRFTILPDTEISLEVNPGTALLTNLQNFRACGINRLSIGVQSFFDTDLQMLDRIHTALEARHTIAAARKAGFDNISVDLIFGIPDQTTKMWQKNVMEITAISPEHVSTYSLSVEDGTPFAQWVAEKKIHPGSDEICREMYLTALENLQRSGYRHYEISNFARPFYECKHNLSYWDGTPYIGLGPSAHSYCQNQRWWNVPGVEHYITQLQNGQKVVAGIEKLGKREQLTEFIMLNLRKTTGFSVSVLEKKFGTVTKSKVLDRVKSLEAKYFYDQNDRIRLTAEGLLLYNTICTELISWF